MKITIRRTLHTIELNANETAELRQTQERAEGVYEWAFRFYTASKWLIFFVVYGWLDGWRLGLAATIYWLIVASMARILAQISETMVEIHLKKIIRDSGINV